jgi:hypothetical protein
MSATLARYEKLIAAMIPASKACPAVQTTGAIPIDVGVAGPIIDMPANSLPSVVDAAGHARPVYLPLLVCGWLRLPSAKDHADELLGWINALDDSALSWLARAMAAQLPGMDRRREAADYFFLQLARDQQPTGALLPADSHANPETRWYDELILLHALAGYTALHPASTLNRAVENAALFHLQETQPDHASAQPWALLAFVQYAQPLADQVLHAMTLQYPAGAVGVPLLLLKDALYGLQKFSRTDEP